ncbi:hypothetical protein AOL_s00211g1 [Orbilia oligospora ATCC 24927]|uniref:Reverse transcriptase domain-containing protein n=1 Tax=Arthrobotrys oligospora (strain ATCC 24927 / CBS 115.81 / DSM 1491) TaxID=756982 RepID=G1XSN6_ARTOA|nr:hypothetical protein AOL_s00211g1 [Orbilia oligospora ATCC 24927]EGX43839.1 hypothetical protein AOL_s00211g1 [Orbilia oligospora ATCC 24927]
MVMPFGLTNAPASFQAFINHVLREHIDVICVIYLDDILIYSKNLEEHKKHVNLILASLQKYDLQYTKEKSEFAVTECEFLGAIITSNSIKMDPKKVQTIQDWPIPQKVKEVQSFLELYNYYRHFIRKYSFMSAALSELTKKQVKFEMTPERIAAFDIFKNSFVSAPILRIYDLKLPIKVETDASVAALGACLLQLHPDKEWYPIAYIFHKFDATQLRYAIHDKELMTIVEACRKWCVYLQTKKPFTVLSDYKNLTYFLTIKELSRRQVCWWELLCEYNMKIVYFKGKENVFADAIS